jgi:hypothetical protein
VLGGTQAHIWECVCLGGGGGGGKEGRGRYLAREEGEKKTVPGPTQIACVRVCTEMGMGGKILSFSKKDRIRNNSLDQSMCVWARVCWPCLLPRQTILCLDSL